MGATAERYKVLFEQGRVTLDGLQKAVAKRLIEKEDYEEITGEKFPRLTSD